MSKLQFGRVVDKTRWVIGGAVCAFSGRRFYLLMQKVDEQADYPGTTFYKIFSTKKDHNNLGKKTSDTVFYPWVSLAGKRSCAHNGNEAAVNTTYSQA